MTAAPRASSAAIARASRALGRDWGGGALAGRAGPPAVAPAPAVGAGPGAGPAPELVGAAPAGRPPAAPPPAGAGPAPAGAGPPPGPRPGRTGSAACGRRRPAACRRSRRRLVRERVGVAEAHVSAPGDLPVGRVDADADAVELRNAVPDGVHHPADFVASRALRIDLQVHLADARLPRLRLEVLDHRLFVKAARADRNLARDPSHDDVATRPALALHFDGRVDRISGHLRVQAGMLFLELLDHRLSILGRR